MAKYKTLDGYVVGKTNTGNTEDQQYMNMLTDIQNSNNFASQAAADSANDFTRESQAKAMEFNAGEAAKNRAFQLSMSNTAHQREVRDLVRAGLNPVLSANNGAAVTSGAAGSVSGSQGIKAEMDMQKAQLFSQYYMNKANNANAVRMNNDQIANAMKMRVLDNATALQQSRMAAAASMYGANASAAAQRYAASAAAAASMYGADQAAAAAKYGYDTGKYNNTYTNDTKQKMQQDKFVYDALMGVPFGNYIYLGYAGVKGYDNYYGIPEQANHSKGSKHQTGQKHTR